MSLPSGADEPFHWHYHEHDAICIALTPVTAVNETFGVAKQQAVVSGKGNVLLYNLRGLPRYVHRCRATCDNAISFIGV